MHLLISLYLFFANNAFARSLKATADKLAQETSRVGHGVALFGLVMAGIYFMIGSQNAATKMTQALMGVGVLMLSPTIISFVKGIA